MKRFLMLFSLLLFTLSAGAADITNISNAFKKGDAASLSASMGQQVDMALPGTSRSCNAADAVGLLNTFFGTNKPSGFSVVHHADKKESGFFVGKLPTSGGEFRVNITYRTEGNNAIIQSIRIE